MSESKKEVSTAPAENKPQEVKPAAPTPDRILPLWSPRWASSKPG